MKKTPESGKNALAGMLTPRGLIRGAVLGTIAVALAIIGCSWNDSPTGPNDGKETTGGEWKEPADGVMTQGTGSPDVAEFAGKYEAVEGGSVTDSRTGISYRTILVREKEWGLGKKTADSTGICLVDTTKGGINKAICTGSDSVWVGTAAEGKCKIRTTIPDITEAKCKIRGTGADSVSYSWAPRPATDIHGVLWLAENLGTNDTAKPPDTVTKYGQLYNYTEAQAACDSVKANSGSTAKWYLPEREDWAKLISATGSLSSSAGMLMKKYSPETDPGAYRKSAGWVYDSKTAGKQNSLYFDGMGSGYYSDKDSATRRALDSSGLWWTATPGSIKGTAYYRGMSWNTYNVIENTYGTGFKFAVRCVLKDKGDTSTTKPTTQLFKVKIAKITNSGYDRTKDIGHVVYTATKPSGDLTNGQLRCDSSSVTTADSIMCDSVSSVTVKADVGSKYTFKYWDVKWTKAGGSGDRDSAQKKGQSTTVTTATIILTGDTSQPTIVTAIFERRKVKLTLTLKDKEGGFVVTTKKDSTRTDTIRVAKDTLKYDIDDTITVSAVPMLGYRFLGWSGESFTGTSPLEIVMDKDKSLTATFQRVWRLTVDDSTISFTPPGIVVTGDTLKNGAFFDAGTKVTLRPKPQTGKEFDRWTGDATSRVSPLTITMNGNKTIGVMFRDATAGGGVTTGGGGAGDTTTKTTIWDGENQSGGAGRCYDTTVANNCDTSKYGRLYTWDQAKDLCENVLGGVLPSRADWNDLIKSTGKTSSSAGLILQTNDAYNFNKFGGYIDLTGKARGIDTSGLWWTSEPGTGINKTSAYYVGMNKEAGNVVTNIYDQAYQFSVRCVYKD